MLNHAPIRLRLTLWYVFLLGVILAVFAAGIYLLLRHSLYENLDESIQSRARTFLTTIQNDGDRLYLPNQSPLGNRTQDEQFARVFDPTGEVIFDDSASLGQVAVDTHSVAVAFAGKLSSRSIGIVADDDLIRVITLPIKRDGEILGVLEMGQSEDDVSETLASLLLIIAIAYPVTLVIAGFGGVFLAGRALSPIDQITRTVRRISAEDLGQRLNMSLPDDEVGRLARTFDEMTARLHESFQRQHHFTADASHELRTPLTVIKGQIDVSLQQEREPEAYRQVLRAVNEEIDHLIRLAGSLLTLTRADSGQIPLVVEEVGIAELVGGVVAQLRPLAIDGQVGLEFENGPSVTIQADEDLLLHLMLNLLDNAIKNTPSGGQVVVRWKMSGDQLAVEVVKGGGIMYHLGGRAPWCGV